MQGVQRFVERTDNPFVLGISQTKQCHAAWHCPITTLLNINVLELFCKCQLTDFFSFSLRTFCHHLKAVITNKFFVVVLNRAKRSRTENTPCCLSFSQNESYLSLPQIKSIYLSVHILSSGWKNARCLTVHSYESEMVAASFPSTLHPTHSQFAGSASSAVG